MASSASIIARDDTLLGVCFALGQDLGFNPIYLRILLAVTVLWSLPAALAAYAALAVPVALSRWLAPEPRPVDETVSEEPHYSEELPLAA